MDGDAAAPPPPTSSTPAVEPAWPPPVLRSAARQAQLVAQLPALADLGQDPTLGLVDLADVGRTGLSYALLKGEAAELQVRTRIFYFMARG
jgi:hypothetical protein